MGSRKGKRSKSQAPGKRYRKGISLKGLIRKFPDNAKAEKWFQEQIWKGKPHCPRCKSENVNLKAKHKTMPHYCRDCRRFFSIKIGTVMEGSNVSCQDWAIATYLHNTNLKGISSMRLHREPEVTRKTAWFILQRLREADGSEVVRFDGTCEVDETCIGGKTSRMNKRHYAGWRKKTDGGRGGVGKTVVGCIRERETGRVQLGILPDTKTETMQSFVIDRTTGTAEIRTDEHSAYKSIDRFCKKHETVNHSLKQYVKYDGLHYITTNACESTFGTLKASILGVYHSISVKHLRYYLNELSGKRNKRELDTEEQMAHNVRAMVGKRIRFEDLTARTPEQEEAYAARNYEKFGLQQACLEAAGLTAMDRKFRGI